MTAVSTRFLDPRVLARIGRLDLIAHAVVDGFVAGLHQSPHLGVSTDFAEHRPYMPGDDVRRVDWRLWDLVAAALTLAAGAGAWRGSRRAGCGGTALLWNREKHVAVAIRLSCPRLVSGELALGQRDRQVLRELWSRRRQHAHWLLGGRGLWLRLSPRGRLWGCLRRLSVRLWGRWRRRSPARNRGGWPWRRCWSA